MTRVSQDVEVSAAVEQDTRLMLQVKEGDETSFEVLLGKYRRPVVSYLNRSSRRGFSRS